MATKRMRGQYEAEVVEMDGGEVMQRCCFCGELLPLTDEYFNKNGYNENGEQRYRKDCKTCYNVRRRANKPRDRKRHQDFICGQKRRGEAVPQLTHQEWKEALIYFGGACAYCGNTPRRGQRLTRDHLQPVSEGGLTTPDNIVPACGHCNSSKQGKEFKAWYLGQECFSQDRLNAVFKWRAIQRQLLEEKKGEGDDGD